MERFFIYKKRQELYDKIIRINVVKVHQSDGVISEIKLSYRKVIELLNPSNVIDKFNEK